MPAQEISLYGAMLGGGQAGQELARLLEGFLTAQVTAALARLGVPDLLVTGPATPGELAPQAGADPDALGRLLAAAAVYGLVRRDSTGRYALTGAGELLCTDADGSARSYAAGFLGPPMWVNAGQLADTVRGGGPADPGAPGGLYDYFGSHPAEAEWFARAMGRATSILVSELTAAAFRPLGSGRFVDVGGSRGTLLAHLLRADPQASGVVFDRAEALSQAPGFLAGQGVADRAEPVAGDFLREVPPGDVHVLCQVIHNWPDDQVRTVAGNCHRAGRPGGWLMVIEYLLPDGPQPSLSHLMDLIMLATVGGRERTRSEHEALLGSCGYTLVRDTPLDRVLPWHVLEFRR